MATPPPLNPQAKKKGCSKGCLIAAAIGFAAFIVLAVIGSLLSDMHWKKERVDILNSIEQAVGAGDFERALSLAHPYESRNDPKLNGLISEAEELKREAKQRARQEKIERLVSEIKAAQGDEREAKLGQLLSLAPATKEFPEEIFAIREKAKIREQEARAKKEAERQVELESKAHAWKEQQRLAMESRLAEFKWQYQVTEDQLTSKPAYLAWVKSINRVNFDFPYQGEQRGKLVLRTHPQHGKDIILRVERGQMLVRSYEDTTVKVVFDDGSPIAFKVVGPSTHGTTSLFFRDYHGFVERMLNAKKAKISVPFYKQGNIVFEFNLSDFDADKYLDKK